MPVHAAPAERPLSVQLILMSFAGMHGNGRDAPKDETALAVTGGKRWTSAK